MTDESKIMALPEVATILLTRLGVLWLLVLISFLLPADNTLFYTFMGAAFIVAVPYSLWLKKKLHATRLATLQFLFDITLVTALVYFTGGVRSHLTLLYPLVILSAGIVGTPRQAVEIAALTMFTYIVLGTLLSKNVLIEYMPSELVRNARTSNSVILLRAAMFAVFGALGIYLSKFFSHGRRDQQQLTETTQTLIKNVPLPLVLINQDGFIILTNKAFGAMLGIDPSTLIGEKFADLCIHSEKTDSENDKRVIHIKTADHSTIPVTCHSALVNLPANAISPEHSDVHQTIDVTLLMLTDISTQLEIEKQLKKVERITAATQLAGEMAHEIRTPLTAISASIQLLRRYEQNATSADWLPNSPRRKDRKELFDHIEEASGRMDQVVQNFVDFAEFSPADLLSIIKLDSNPENKGYIRHLNTLGRDFTHGQNTDSGRRSDHTQLVE